MKRKVVIVAVIVFVAVLLLLGFRNNDDNTGGITSTQSQDRVPIGKEIPVLGQEHIAEGTTIAYNSNPPTSGNHWPEPAELGVYTVELPDEQLVHNLEHGAVWISYRDLDIKDIEVLRAIAFKYPDAVILTPRAANPSPTVLVSWGRMLEMQTLDSATIENFVLSNTNNAPEPLARLTNAVDVPKAGDLFPLFNLTEVDGRLLSVDTLAGKPAIVWFTTSWCVPCQLGALDTSKLDDELGGDAFNVLVVFIDPRESDEDLLNWRRSFANPDWMVAFDNFEDGLAEKLAVRFLDTKYLLDQNGNIVDIDEAQVNDAYIRLIRETIESST